MIESLRARDAARAAHRCGRTAGARRRPARPASPTLEEARDRALPDDALAEAADAVADHDAALAAVRALAGDPELRRVAEQPAPDLTALADAAREAAGPAHRRRRGRRADRAPRRPASAGLVDVARTRPSPRWAPVRDELDLATRMSSFAEGKSPDNRLQMRLSAYVLAHRLSQVVAAANDRLATMSDRRYTLEHTGPPRRRRDPRRPQPARARRLVGRGARPGHPLGRRDLRRLAGAGPRAGRRDHPRGRPAPTSTRCSSTRASAPSTPTPSTT